MPYAEGMRKGQAAIPAALAVALFAGVAGAQQDAPPESHARYKVQPLNLRKEQLGTEAYTQAGRSRMRSGDCEGALDAFDAALRTTTADPTKMAGSTRGCPAP